MQKNLPEFSQSAINRYLRQPSQPVKEYSPVRSGGACPFNMEETTIMDGCCEDSHGASMTVPMVVSLSPLLGGKKGGWRQRVTLLRPHGIGGSQDVLCARTKCSAWPGFPGSSSLCWPPLIQRTIEFKNGGTVRLDPALLYHCVRVHACVRGCDHTYMCGSDPVTDHLCH